MANRYSKIPLLKINKKQLYATSRYPEIPLSENDTYVYTVQGDRFDVLAQQYYNDKSLWYIISIANDQLKQDSLVIPEGIQIRIPANFTEVIRQFNQINKL